MRLFSNPIPRIPLPLDKGKGEDIFYRGASPLLNSPFLLLRRRGEEILERGFAPLSYLHSPFPGKGRGSGGWVAK